MTTQPYKQIKIVGCASHFELTSDGLRNIEPKAPD